MSEGRRRLVVSASSFWLLAIHRSRLVQALQDEGFSILIVAPDGRGADQLVSLGAEVEPLEFQPTGKSPLLDLIMLTRFVALFRRVRPAAFLGFTVKPNIFGSLAARACGVPTINNISGLGRVFASRSLLTRLVETLYRLAFRRSPVVFFENRHDADLFLARHIVRQEQVVLLPGAGLDLDKFVPSAVGVGRPSGAAFTFLLAGRLIWEKGIREFVEAAQLLRESHPQARFQILGFAEPPGRASVSAEVLLDWHRAGMIEYLGGTSDVRPFIAQADCVVLPSFYREGVPRILMEAGAMAKPVVTTDMPGCADAVDDGLTGFLCAPRSAESLAAAMQRVLRMPPRELERMGSAARRKMEVEFRDDIVHRAYIDALRNLNLSLS